MTADTHPAEGRVTPRQYAKQEHAAGRFPSMIIVAVHDRFALADRDFNFLDHDLFDEKEAAERFRSRVLDQVHRSAR